MCPVRSVTYVSGPDREMLEARVGFEPTNGGFADLSLRPLGYRAKRSSIANHATAVSAPYAPGRAYSHRIPLARVKCLSEKRLSEMAARLGGEPGGRRRLEFRRYGYFRPLFRSGA